MCCSQLGQSYLSKHFSDSLTKVLLVPVVGERKAVIVAAIVFFTASLLTSYVILALAMQRTYSIPSNEVNSNSSTRGGEYFESGVPSFVFFGPRIGATNVSLDTLIYVYQTRDADVDLQMSPQVSWYKIENVDDPPASRNTIFYPAELLQPNTTYNVSGSITSYSVWWTFTTASSVIPQTEYEYIPSPHVWWIAIIAASIFTSIFVKIIWRPKHKKN